MPDTAFGYEPGAWIEIEGERLAVEERIAKLQNEIDRLQIGIGQEANVIARQQMQMQLRQAMQDMEFQREQLHQKRRETELALATSPIDFVAYEQYKRSLQEEAPGRLEKAQAADISALEGISPALAQLRRLRIEGGQIEPVDYGPVGPVHTDVEMQEMLAQATGVTGGRMRGEFGAAIPTTQQYSRAGFGKVSPNEMQVLASFLRAGVGPGKTTIDPTEYFREMEEGFVPTLQRTGPAQYKF